MGYDMDAHDTRLTELIDGQKQFIVPVFQRDYSWGTKHCQQLWRDKHHQVVLIDGQQRLL
jgi:uncharacterized protein with ParB-like and HNH nuclease domain